MVREDVVFWIKSLTLTLLAAIALNTCDVSKNKDRVYNISLSIPERNLSDSELSSTNDYPVPLTERKKWCERKRECKKLAEAIVFEARGEPLAGAVAVAFVIKQRAESNRWPDTISEVIDYKCHFSYTCEPPQKGKVTKNDWDRAYVIGYDVMNGLIQNNVDDADHYLNPDKVKRMPKWAKEYEHVATIGNHKFYRSN